MRCEELMKKDVQYVSPDDGCEVAARKMRDRNIGFLPVCENKKVVGVITDRDIVVRLVADDLSPSTKVSDVMTREIISVRPQEDLRSAERLMGRHQKSRIVCIDERGLLAGVISLSDIAQAEADTQAAKTMREVTEREATVH
jgi:CBS domain-containing protein